MKLTYLGHSAILLQDDVFQAIIDPFLTGNPLCQVELKDLPRLTHIFVTHGHGDHMGDTIKLAKEFDAVVVSNAEICAYLGKFGLKTRAMHIGGRTTIERCRVKMTPALHGSGIENDGEMIYGGNPCGFVIERNGKKVYHAGDTGLTMDMKLLEDEAIDVALLPIGGNYTMDLDDAVKAAEFIKAKLVVPIHFDTFPVIKADPEAFCAKVKCSKTVVLPYGGSLEV